MENEGILYVFPIFQAAVWGQKIRRSAADDLFRVSLITRLLSPALICAFVPSFVLANNWDPEQGSISIEANEAGQTVTQGNTTQPDNDPVITSNGNSTSNTVTIEAEGNATAKVTLNNVNIDVRNEDKAAITTQGKGDVTIELDGTNKVVSGDNHAGLEKNNEGNLTITDSTPEQGSLDATGSDYGAGIGGGFGGAGIGGGAKDGQDSKELPQDPGKLNEGTIQYYAPGADMKTGTPTKILYNPNGSHNWDGGTVNTPAACATPGVKSYTCQTHSVHTKTEEIPALGHLFENYVYNNDATTEADGTETAVCAHAGCTVTDTRMAKGTKLEATNQQDTQVPNQQSPYWVTGPEGQSLSYQAQQKDGVLTVTVQEDTASFHGTIESLRQLEAQGITDIRFVTNGAQSGFALSDLLASGTGNVTLTHEGDKVTFTLESTDISGILK